MRGSVMSRNDQWRSTVENGGQSRQIWAYCIYLILSASIVWCLIIYGWCTLLYGTTSIILCRLPMISMSSHYHPWIISATFSTHCGLYLLICAEKFAWALHFKLSASSCWWKDIGCPELAIIIRTLWICIFCYLLFTLLTLLIAVQSAKVKSQPIMSRLHWVCC